MKLTDGEIITLSNNKEYICVTTINLENKEYILLMSNFKPLEIKFAEQNIKDNNIEIRVINNQAEKTKIIEALTNEINSQE